MTKESELCTCITHSLAYGYKIPDDVMGMGPKRCFDLIGINPMTNRFCCIEAKFLKTLQAFNFKRIEKHQDYWLEAYSHWVDCYVIVGVNVRRNDVRAYILKWDTNMSSLYKSGFSIHKKDLIKLPYNKITNMHFTFEKVITFDDLTAK